MAVKDYDGPTMRVYCVYELVSRINVDETDLHFPSRIAIRKALESIFQYRAYAIGSCK